MQVENTTYSGIGKNFAISIDPYFKVDEPLTDFTGRPVYKGEEYYIFNHDGEIAYIHIEDVQEFLQDERLDDADDYDEVIALIECYYSNYPVIM